MIILVRQRKNNRGVLSDGFRSGRILFKSNKEGNFSSLYNTVVKCCRSHLYFIYYSSRLYIFSSSSLSPD